MNEAKKMETLDHLVRSWHDHSEPVDIGGGFSVEVWGNAFRLLLNGAIIRNEFQWPVILQSIPHCILEAERIREGQRDCWSLDSRTWPLDWQEERDDYLNAIHGCHGAMHCDAGQWLWLEQVVHRDEIYWRVLGDDSRRWPTVDAAKAGVQHRHDEAMRAALKGEK